MSRKPNIKWRKSDTEKLTKTIKNFNAKIYRNLRKHPELKDVLPKPILKGDKEKLIADLQSKPRSEFKAEIESLKRFSKRDAIDSVQLQSGEFVTKWEVKETRLKTARVNKLLEQERKLAENAKVTSQGIPTGLTRREMGSERMNELKPVKLDLNKIRSRKELRMFERGIEKRLERNRNQEYKDNYLKALDRIYGDYADEIRYYIERLPAEKVVELYYREQEAAISFHYEPQDEDLKMEILEKIWRAEWQKFKDEGG